MKSHKNPNEKDNNLRANLPTPSKLLHPHLQQRLPHKRAARIEHRRRAPGTLILLLDLRESALDALLAGDIRADTDRFAARAVDLLDEGFVVFG